MGLLDDKLSYMQLQNSGETVDADNLYEQNAKYYERAKNANVIPCFAGDDLQAKVDAASTGGVIDPYGVLDYRPRVPGLLTSYDSAPGAHVKPAYTKDNIVILQKGGTYDTLKKARDAAGDGGVILCVPDAVVSPGEGTPLADAVAAASAGGVLYLNAGTYGEAAVTIDKDLTLVGAGKDVVSITNALVCGSATTEVIGLAGISHPADLSWDGDKLYIVDCHIGGGIGSEYGIHSTYGGTELECWNSELEALVCGAISILSGSTVSVKLHHCYVHTNDDVANNGTAFKNIGGSGSVINAYDCKFGRVIVDAVSTATIPVVSCADTGVVLTFERCHFISDVSGGTALETDMLLNPAVVLADDVSANTITAIDCYFESNSGAGVTVTHIGKNAASTVRYARCAANDDLAVASGVTEMKALQH